MVGVYTVTCLVHGADMGISSTGATVERKTSHNPHSLIIGTALKTEAGLRWLTYRQWWQRLST